ncbi:MAG: hypothetical protein Q8L26_06425 [Candidatus Omnitrophota bacterium]|nr:hypothetical protein [Candidatus Omnitrophota bacterium]
MGKINTYSLIYGIPCDNFCREHKKENILISEMRPQLIGPKILINKLKKAGINSTLISDNALGHMFFTGRIKQVYLFGSDNKFPCGAHTVKILADWHKIPVEILKGENANTKFLDKDAKTFLGKKVTVKKIRTIAPQNENLQ